MTAPLAGVRALVFDAYGTLFDVASATALAGEALGARAAAVGELWRQKQLQYTWLRALMGRHADFWQVTGDALDFALEASGVADAALRRRLMDGYERIAPHADAREALLRVRAAGARVAILSNGTPRMLAGAAAAAGLAELVDELLSVEAVGVYKPHPAVYRLAADRLGLWPAEIGFVSSNGWDAFGAKAFGFRVAWCNRSGQPAERLPEPPDAVIRSLAELPPLLGG